MEEVRGNAATRAKQKYNAANYERLYPYVPKGRKAVYEAAAKASGAGSLNEFIVAAIEEKIEREGLE